MSKIAIFVSHRTDIDSVCINNKIYKHVRCGAILDKKNESNLQGDDMGDNISHLKPYYSEFTVQYWAWKNYKADYYGLCHYRRYLSFSNQKYATNDPNNHVIENEINKKIIEKFALNKSAMSKIIKKYDIITSEVIDIKKLNIAMTPNTVKEAFLYNPRVSITDKHIDMLLEEIQMRFPEYYAIALKHLSSQCHHGFNCYVMKKELFHKMCTFEFSVMDSLLKRIDCGSLEGNSTRIIGYLGEILYGIFLEWAKQENYSILETQKVFFRNTNKTASVSNSQKINNFTKKIFNILSPAYRVALRIEERQIQNLVHLEKEHKSLKQDLVVANTCINNVYNRINFSFWLFSPEYPTDIDSIKLNFWGNFPPAEGDLKLIQDGSYLLLKRLHKICSEINVSFWLHGGSLVGGVRHGSFVPWDDDIDVAMMRTDFNKLVNALNSDGKYQVQEYYYHALMCRSYRFKRVDMNVNVFVDIFIFDSYDSNLSSEILWNTLKQTKCHMGIDFKNIINVPPLNEGQLNNIALYEYPDIKQSLDCLLDQYIDKFSSTNSTSQYLYWGLDNNYENHTRPSWHSGRVFKREQIFPLKTTRFNDLECYIPNDYIAHLDTEYGGNYLDIPNDIGVSKHKSTYFKNKEDLMQIEKLIEVETRNR